LSGGRILLNVAQLLQGMEKAKAGAFMYAHSLGDFSHTQGALVTGKLLKDCKGSSDGLYEIVFSFHKQIERNYRDDSCFSESCH
jgi:hypothetical protein